jgi:hypothetical protein
MSDWLTYSNYIVMVMQVIVTLVIVPLLSIKKLNDITNQYGLVRYPNAKPDVEVFFISSKKWYWITVGTAFLIAAAMVLHAFTNNTELLAWDDQSGLMLIYLLSMVPVLKMVLMHRNLFGIFKKHTGSVRSASLKVRKWQDYISIPLLITIIIANIFYIATVIYFSKHPFVGFAGYFNLLGLFVLDFIFLFIIVIVYKDNKTNGFHHPQHRDALKKRAIHINMLILAIAAFHVSFSMWIQGTDLSIYKIIFQSLYLILILTSVSLTLPKSVFDKQ